MKQLEIERKFLIKMPDTALLDGFDGGVRVSITQTYTTVGIRLRRWEEGEKVSYIKTEKKKISHLTRIEDEQEITREEYDKLMLLADKSLSPLEKTRYRLPYMGKTVEIDIFPFWQKQAFCEVELESEEEQFELPDFVEVIREVTADKRYRNYALAKEIPKEENF